MKHIVMIVILSIFSVAKLKADYISYYLIHVGVDHTLKENVRQKDMKSKQLQVSTLEVNNTNSTNNFKEKYKRVKERLNKLSLLLDGFFLTAEAYPTLQQIIDTQKEIYQECKDNPVLIPLSIESEVVFVDKAQMLIRFIAGLILTYGDINQMKSGDRKMLLNHAIDQLDKLNAHAFTLLANIRNYKYTFLIKKQGFEDWINRDKEIITDIINNAKTIGE